jgi:hypothetical protein
MNLKTPFAAALLLSALSFSALADDTLSGQDLRKLAPGRYAVNLMGVVSMTVSLKPNGTLSATTSKGKRDTGQWSVQGERLCVAWDSWLNGKRRCTALSGSDGQYSGGGMWMRRI